MTKKIKISLSSKSISEAIRELREYEKWVKLKTEELTEQLALIGAKEASILFARAMYDGTNDSHVTVERTSNGWAIIAQGNAVFFIEFGAGVYYNGSEPYPNQRPAGVSKIGEYGKGRGKRKTWGYYDANGESVLTHGNPAAMPMYYASVEMERQVKRIAQEVFG